MSLSPSRPLISDKLWRPPLSASSVSCPPGVAVHSLTFGVRTGHPAKPCYPRQVDSEQGRPHVRRQPPRAAAPSASATAPPPPPQALSPPQPPSHLKPPNLPPCAPAPQLTAMVDVAAVEETVKRLASHKGVVGIAIVNGDGVPIRTTLDPELATQYAALVSQLVLKARFMVRELAADGTDDLQFLRVRSKRHEIMIAPGFDRVCGCCPPGLGCCDHLGFKQTCPAAAVCLNSAPCLVPSKAGHASIAQHPPTHRPPSLLPVCAGPQLHPAGGAGAAGGVRQHRCRLSGGWAAVELMFRAASQHALPSAANSNSPSDGTVPSRPPLQLSAPGAPGAAVYAKV